MPILRKVDKDFSFEEQRVELNELALDVYNLANSVGNFTLDDLTDVTALGATNQQIIKYNGTEWVLDTDILSTSFNITTAAASGGGALAYNSGTGTFTYTPPDLSGYLTSLGPIGGHTDVTISNPQNDHVLKWNGTAWVNAPENQSIVNSFVGLNDTPSNFTANKWIKVNAGGNALEWADAPQTAINSVNDINDVTITNAQTDQILKWDGNNWINFTPGYLTSFTEQDPTVPAHVKSITQGNITQWNSALQGLGSINGHDDVTITSPSNGQVLKYNSTTSRWENAADAAGSSQVNADWAATSGLAEILNKPTLVTNLGGLSDVDTTGAANGKILKHNGTSWVIADDASGSGGSTVTTSDTAPSSPADGDLWWKSDEGRLKIFYSDTDSNQWVDTNPVGTGGSGGGGATVTTDDNAPSNPNDGDLWYKTDEGQLKVYYDDGSGSPSAQWVDTAGGSGIQLTSISVGADGTASGNGSLGYNNTTGVFTYTPPNLSLYSQTTHTHTFASLTDTPANYTNQGGKYLKVNSGATAIEFGDAPTYTFTALTDTPSTFTAGKYLKVNTGGTALEWADVTPDTNTSYSQSSVASGANVNLRLTGSDSTNDDILITAGNNVTFSSVTSAGFTINSTGGGGSGNQGNDSVAVGSICIWSGTVANIPTGWHLCDGTNNTVDLRDKFIVGAKQDDGGVAKTNVTGALTQSGGSKDSTLPAHNHGGTTGGGGSHNHGGNTGDNGSHTHSGTFTGSAATTSNGDHSHNDPTWDGGSGNYEVPHYPPSNESTNHSHNSHGGYDYGSHSAPTTTNGNHAHDFSVACSGTTSSNGQHSHTISNQSDHTHTISQDGVSGTNANLVPYYSLCYIQKVTAGGASFSLSVVTAAPSGGGALSYNNTTGVFSFTPADVSGGGGGSATINNNADNRLITGSATAGTLNGESNATYDGSKLNINSTDGSGQSITSSGIIKAGTHLEATGRLSVNENIQSNGFTYTQSTNSLVVDGSISDGAGNVREIVNNAKTAAYTLSADDTGELINTDSNITVPSGVLVAGQAVTIFNNSNSNISIIRSGVTLWTAGTDSNTDKTLARKGICTIVCVSQNGFVISGAGLT